MKFKQTAATVTHEMGHNLGLQHYDEDDTCTCHVSHGCIMRSAASSNQESTQWSSCSVEKFGTLAEIPCIYNEPDPDIFWDQAKCGDGLVTGDEECDCGHLVTGGVTTDYRQLLLCWNQIQKLKA